MEKMSQRNSINATIYRRRRGRGGGEGQKNQGITINRK